MTWVNTSETIWMAALLCFMIWGTYHALYVGGRVLITCLRTGWLLVEGRIYNRDAHRGIFFFVVIEWLLIFLIFVVCAAALMNFWVEQITNVKLSFWPSVGLVVLVASLP
jgi:hypothetical protein